MKDACAFLVAVGIVGALLSVCARSGQIPRARRPFNLTNHWLWYRSAN